MTATENKPGIDEQIAFVRWVLTTDIDDDDKQKWQAILATLREYKRITEAVMPEVMPEPVAFHAIREGYQGAQLAVWFSDYMLLKMNEELLRAVAMKNAGDAEIVDWLETNGGLIGIQHEKYGDYRIYAGDNFKSLRVTIRAEIEKARGG